jgi:hypothetical protein
MVAVDNEKSKNKFNMITARNSRHCGKTAKRKRAKRETPTTQKKKFLDGFRQVNSCKIPKLGYSIQSKSILLTWIAIACSENEGRGSLSCRNVQQTTTDDLVWGVWAAQKKYLDRNFAKNDDIPLDAVQPGTQLHLLNASTKRQLVSEGSTGGDSLLGIDSLYEGRSDTAPSIR